jgi:RimJ/RimL family protein N-acetyltransferase
MAAGVERLGPRLWRTRDHEGRGYTLRPLVPEDAPALMRAYEAEAPEDRLMRLFTALPRLPRRLAVKLCTVDPLRDVALVWVPDDAPGELAGGARLMRDAAGDGAEFAVSVASHLKGRGLGCKALETALEAGAELGIGRVWGTVSRRNLGMRGLAKRLGMTERPDPDDRTLVICEKRLG